MASPIYNMTPIMPVHFKVSSIFFFICIVVNFPGNLHIFTLPLSTKALPVRLTLICENKKNHKTPNSRNFGGQFLTASLKPMHIAKPPRRLRSQSFNVWIELLEVIHMKNVV